MIEKLSAQDKWAIDEYRSCFAIGDNDNNVRNMDSMCSCEHFLRFWGESKSNYLSKLFGDELILSREVSFTKTAEDLQEDPSIRGFINELDELKYKFFNNIIAYIPCNTRARSVVINLFQTDTILSNKYTGSTVTFNNSYNESYRLTSGCKAIKAIIGLNNLYHFASNEEIERFRILQSRCTNTAKVTGTLCLSIHPLDYMSMSDNSLGWTSCMSWEDSGCYRQGTIEMMNSPYVIVVYLKSAHPYNVSNSLKWNNKKWRSLYIVTPEVVTSIKGYPYEHRELDRLATEWLYELAVKANPEIVYTKPASYNSNQINNVSLKIRTNFMYNDYYNALSVTHFGFIKEGIGEEVSYNISGYSMCALCGEINVAFKEDSLLCEECAPASVAICEECGRRIFDENEVFWVRDTCICANCFDDIGVRNDETKENDFLVNCSRIVILPDILAREGSENLIKAYLNEISSSSATNLHVSCINNDTDIFGADVFSSIARDDIYTSICDHGIIKNEEYVRFTAGWQKLFSAWMREDLVCSFNLDLPLFQRPAFIYDGNIVLNSKAVNDSMQDGYKELMYFEVENKIYGWQWKLSEELNELFHFFNRTGMFSKSYREFDI